MINNRDEPKYYIDKKGGIRHLVHFAIRTYFSFEDQFALQLVIQSADRAVLDLADKWGAKITFDPRKCVKPERLKEYFNLLREVSNFLKHADRNPNLQLGIYDVAKYNTFTLWMLCLNYVDLFQETTEHIKIFNSISSIMLHEYVDSEETKENFCKIKKLYGDSSLGDVLADWYKISLKTNLLLHKELEEDLEDAIEFRKMPLSTFKQKP